MGTSTEFDPGETVKLLRYKKLRLDPRPYKFFCGHTVVLDKSENYKGSISNQGDDLFAFYLVYNSREFSFSKNS